MLTRKELAQGLDISQPMVSRLVARGMPDSSIGAAEEWRRQNLNIARVKRGRRVQMLTAAELVASAQRMVDFAGQTLDDRNAAGFDALVPAVRAAMAAVPHQARDAVQLRFDVMDRLVAPLPEMCREALAEAGDDAPEPPMSDADAAAMGKFWYAIAAGESAQLPEV